MHKKYSFYATLTQLLCFSLNLFSAILFFCGIFAFEGNSNFWPNPMHPCVRVLQILFVGQKIFWFSKIWSKL